MWQVCEEWQEVVLRDPTVPQELPRWGTDQGTGPHQPFPHTSFLHFDAFWCRLCFGGEIFLGLVLGKSLILGLRLGQNLRDQYVCLGFTYLWLVLVSGLKHQQQILGVCEALRHFLSVFLWHGVWIMELEMRVGIKVSLSQLSEFWPQV